MFENILHQESVVKRLKQDVSHKTLPSSLLFYGEPYTGKTTTVLELARVLTCEKNKAEWNCRCHSCEQHRVLQHPSVVLFGNRYFLEEITACGDVLSRNRKVFAQYMFTRAVRKLVRRFDPEFQVNGPKSAKVFQDIQQIEDVLERLLPGKELPDEKRVKKALESIISISRKIILSFGREMIPVAQVRKVAFWAHTSGPGKRKIVVFENADTMLESSRNALLKLLEEPPGDCYFILTAKQKGSIIPTVLSRVRPYHFTPRSPEASRDVLKKIFREPSDDYATLKEYFLAWGNLDPVLLRNITGKWIDHLLTGTAEVERDPLVSEIVHLSEEKGYASLFIEELITRMRSCFSPEEGRERIDPRLLRRIEAWRNLLHESYYRMETYNQRPSLIIEQMLYRMTETK